MLENINNFHNNIAGDVWPNGAKLTCKECGEIVTISTEECATYLAHGWPEHHGSSMLLETIED